MPTSAVIQDIAEVTEKVRGRRESDRLGWKILGWMLDILVAILMMLAIWTGKQLFELEGRLTILDQNLTAHIVIIRDLQQNQRETLQQIQDLKLWKARLDVSLFTAIDGKEVWQEIYRLKDSVSRMTTEIPAWFLQRIEKIENTVDKIDERTRVLERKSPSVGG